MKKTVVTLTLLFSIFVLSSCTGSSQLHQRLIIQGIGIDKIKGEIILTLQCLKADTSTGVDTEYEIVESVGKSINSAFSSATLKTGKQALLGQCHYIVFGRNTVQNNIKKEINYFVNSYEFPPNVSVFVSDTKAEDIVKLKNITPNIFEQIAEGQKITGQIYGMSVKDISSAFNNGREVPVTTLLTANKNKINVIGSVLIQENSNNQLTPRECVALNIINNKMTEMSDFVEYNNDTIDYLLKNCKTNIKIKKQKNYKIEVNITAKLELISDAEKKLKEKIQKNIEENITSTFEKVINEYKSNVFFLDKYLRQQNNEQYKELVSQSGDFTNSVIKVNLTFL